MKHCRQFSCSFHDHIQLVICHTQIYCHPQTIVYVLITNFHRQLVHEDLSIHFSIMVASTICTSPFYLQCYKLFPIVFNCLCFEITVIQSSYIVNYLRMICCALTTRASWNFPICKLLCYNALEIQPLPHEYISFLQLVY